MRVWTVEDDIKRFDDIRLVVFGASLGTAFSRLSFDPSDVASAAIVVFPMLFLIAAAYGAHTLSTANSGHNWRYHLSFLGVVLFTAGIIVLPFIDRGLEVISRNLGIGYRDLYLILLMLYSWVITSLFVALIRQKSAKARENEEAKAYNLNLTEERYENALTRRVSL